MISSRRNVFPAAVAVVVLSAAGAQSPGQSRRLYWGDIHNHNAVGYGKGSLQRSYDIAESHLDFFAFTAHGHWHDMPIMPENKHEKWVNGFAATREHWDEVPRMANEHYKPGRFVPFVAYEWHSSKFGDHCLIYPSDTDTPLSYFDHISKVQAFAKEKNALLIPHHPAYRWEWRGTAFEFLDEAVSPVVEIFSEHGLAESDRGHSTMFATATAGGGRRGLCERFWPEAPMSASWPARTTTAATRARIVRAWSACMPSS